MHQLQGSDLVQQTGGKHVEPMRLHHYFSSVFSTDSPIRDLLSTSSPKSFAFYGMVTALT
jgi:hypothetical protein